MKEIEDNKTTPPRGTFSIEKLVHFSCSDCQRWWTIGDGYETAYYYCPHCGKCQGFDPAKPLRVP